MQPLNRQQTEDLILDLYYNQKKTFREVQKITRKSPRDISNVLNKVEPERSSLSKAYKVFSVLTWTVTEIGIFYAILSSIMVFVEGLVLRRALKKFSEEQLVIISSIILGANSPTANNDNPSIEYRCRELDAPDIFLSTFAFSFMKDDRGI